MLPLSDTHIFCLGSLGLHLLETAKLASSPLVLPQDIMSGTSQTRAARLQTDWPISEP